MADNTKAIELLFGVAGDGDINGKSGKMIKEQLEAIAERVNLQVQVNINKNHFRQQLQSLKKELDQTLGNLNINITQRGNSQRGDSNGGNSGKSANASNKPFIRLKATLNEIFALQKKIDSANKDGNVNLAKEYENTRQALINNYKVIQENAVAAKQITDEELAQLEEKKASLERLTKARQEDAKAAQARAAVEKEEKLLQSKQSKADALLANAERLLQRDSYLIQNSDKAAAAAERLRSAILGVRDAYNKSPQELAEATDKLSQSIRNTDEQFAIATVEAETFGFKVKKAFETKVVQNFAYAILAFIVSSLKKVYDNVKDLDAAVTDLQIATGYTRERAKELMKTYAQMAQQIGATADEVAAAADTWLRQGYSVAQTEELIKNTMYLSKLGQIDSAEAAKALTSAMKGYNIAVQESIGIVDKFTAVDMDAAVSAGDIATAMAETSVSANTAGVSIDRLIGYIATVSEVTQDGAESVGTFYKTMFARMSNIKAGRFVDDETGESLNDVAAVLGKIGVALFDSEGQFKSFEAVLDEVGNKWEKLDSKQQAAIATAMAGTRQQEKFKVLMENYSKAMEFSKTSSESAGTALLKYQEAYADSIEAKMKALGAAWQEFSVTILDSELVKGIATILKYAVDGLNNLAQKGSLLTTVLTVIAGVLLPKLEAGVISLGTAIKSNLVGSISSLIVIASALINAFDGIPDWIQGVIPLVSMLAISITAAIKWVSNDINSGIASINAGVEKGGQAISSSKLLMIIGTLISLISFVRSSFGEAGDGIATACSFIAAAVTGLFFAINIATKGFMASNPFGWILAIISLVVTGIMSLVEALKQPSFEDLKKAAEESKSAWKEVNGELEEVNSKIEEIGKSLDELRKKENPSFVDEAEIKRLERELTLLEQQAKVKADEEKQAKATAAHDAMVALDKYNDENSFTDLLYNTALESAQKRLDSLQPGDEGYDAAAKLVQDIQRNLDKKLGESLAEYGSLLEGFEYNSTMGINQYLDRYYDMLDKYTFNNQGADAAWESVLSREKYSDAISVFEDLANSSKNIEELQNALGGIGQTNPKVAEFLSYIKQLGLWDGENLTSLAQGISTLRDSFVALPIVDIISDIETLTKKCSDLTNAFEEIGESGILSLDTIKSLMENNSAALEKYFTRTIDGYKLNSLYSGMDKYSLLETLAVDELMEYQKQLDDAKKKLSELSEGDYDYEAAVKNVIIAQDNLNNKTIEYSTILREAAIEQETQRLNDQLDAYEDLIEKRKELLKTYQDELNYQKELAQKQKTVAQLQTQLAVAKLDNSAAGQARVRELESELSKAQEDLDEYTLERAIEDIEAQMDGDYERQKALIEDQITTIANCLGDILRELTTADGIKVRFDTTDLPFSGESMYALRQDIKEKGEAGMDVGENTAAGKFAKAFDEGKKTGDLTEASRLYIEAKDQASNFTAPSTPEDEEAAPELTPDKEATQKVKTVDGFRESPDASGWKNFNMSDVAGGSNDSGMISLNSKKQRNAKITSYKPELNGVARAAGVKDKHVFGYNGNLYLYKDGKVGKLSKDGIHGIDWDAIQDYADKKFGIYHTGGFVGGYNSLQSNEEFAKLLKGEFVSTPAQMDRFMKETLPTLASRAAGGDVNYNAPLIHLECGTVTQETLPDVKKIVDKAVKTIQQQIDSGLSRNGFKRTVNKFSTKPNRE